MLIVCRWIHAAQEVPEQAPCRGGGQHKPDPVLAPPPTVAPSALSAGVAAFTRSCGRVCG